MRFVRLDAFRGLLAIGVLVFHCGFEEIFPWYWLSMDIFFVMSGFLIMRTLLQFYENEKGALDFFVYRFCKLFPVFAISLLIYEIILAEKRDFLLDVSPLGTVPDSGFSLYYIFLLHNLDYLFYGQKVFGEAREFAHFWSLVLEEQFYIICGFFFVLGKKIKISFSKQIFLGLLLIIISIYLRYMGLHWWVIFSRWDGFIVGSILGLSVFSGKLLVLLKDNFVRNTIIFFIMFFSIFTFFIIYKSYFSEITVILSGKNNYYNVTVVSVFSAFLIYGIYYIDVTRPNPPQWAFILGWIGGISYELYVVHFPIKEAMQWFKIAEFGTFLFLFFNLALSLLVAVILHYTVTRTMVLNRDRIVCFLRNWRWQAPSNLDT